jgi:hypothetical protein
MFLFHRTSHFDDDSDRTHAADRSIPTAKDTRGANPKSSRARAAGYSWSRASRYTACRVSSGRPSTFNNPNGASIVPATAIAAGKGSTSRGRR